MSFTPTSEQQAALDLFATGESLKIEAGAGSGKTSTLVLLAESTERRGQYIAFNKAIVTEAGRKFPGNVNCSTAHSLAYRAVGHEFSHRMRGSQRMRSLDIANRLGIDALKVTTFAGEEKLLSQSFLAGIAMRAVTRFCQSADDEPSFIHVPKIEGLDAADEGRGPVNRAVAKHLEPAVKRAWEDLTNVEGSLPYKHDAYLKLWQLSKPRIGADFILFDEAQDANPVMVAIVAAQTHAQLVWVGDSQQQIYSFTGAVNALEKVPADHTTFLTQSFRFGPAVAEVANSVLDRIESAELRIRGTETINSVVGPVAEPDAVLTRTNAAAIRTALEALRNGKRVSLVGGAGEITRFAKAARDLQNGERTDHPELACFEDWREVQDYVAEDEQGGELKLMVGLIDEFTVETILTQLASLDDDEAKADLIVSTAHKSKGREWDSVQLAGDFPDQPADEEKRLLYVAVTRARRELDIDAVDFLSSEWTEQDAPVATTEKLAQARIEAKVETVESDEQESEYAGEVGDKLDIEVKVEKSHGMTTKYGYTYLTTFVDEDGRRYKAFMQDELTEGVTLWITCKVKAHEEFRGVRETRINYVNIIEEVAA